MKCPYCKSENTGIIDSRLSDDGVKFEHFALFMGIAMSITAFPVLARILTERKLLQTELGSVAIARRTEGKQARNAAQAFRETG